ncbi:MAG TPA: ABC transporter permease [Candidatus Didemnitutus sp.]|nr:ABC transporter permease [Candidatus Didemnitutus sp.]
MLQELRHALRALARHPRFTTVTMLTLALGIGSAAAIFSVTDWVLFRSHRFPTDVYFVGGQWQDHGFLPWRYPAAVEAYRHQANISADWCLTERLQGNVVVNGEPVATSWIGTNANLFTMFGVVMERGRGFVPGEDGASPAPVAVVSDHFWRTFLGGQDDAIGRKIRVGDSICTVIGVVHAWESLPGFFANDVYRPKNFRFDQKEPWEMVNLMPLVRLKSGITPEAATAAFSAAKYDRPDWLKQWMTDDRPVLASMAKINETWRADVYWVLVAAVGILYAIACLNASNLILLRMLGQRRELCIRLAVGCSRGRLVRFLVLQNGVLTLFSALGGALVANWVFPLLLLATGNSGTTFNWLAWSLDLRVLIVLGGLTILTSLLVVVIPAWRVLRADISGGLKDGGGALGESRPLARLRAGLVVSQAAFAVILLVGAGLMVRTFDRLREVNLGFDPTRRIKIEGGFPTEPLAGEARRIRLSEICEHLRHIPGVVAAGFDTNLLLPGYKYTSLSIEGADGKNLPITIGLFTAGYQDAAGLALKRGRWLTLADNTEVMVNESLARTQWPNQNPIGQVLRPIEPGTSSGEKHGGWTVVGVVGDFRSTVRDAPGLWVLESPRFVGSMGTCIVKLSMDYDEAFGGRLRRDLYAFEPKMVVTRISPLGQLRDQQLQLEHMADSVMRVLAGIALLLTVVGLYSVLAYSVDLRMGEFGVRVALGAGSRDIIRLVLRRGLLLTVPGLALGVIVSVTLSRFLKSLLFGVSGQDPMVLAVVAVTLLLVGFAACLLPARRAIRVDIARLLRSE